MEALAKASLAHIPKSAKAASKGRSYILSKQPAHLSDENVLIAVVDGKSVAVRTVRKPARLTGGSRHEGALARDVARRLAEIEAVVNDMLSASGQGAGSEEASSLTADEERVLVTGGFDTAPLRAEEEEPVTRTALEFARLLEASLSVKQTATMLDVDPSRVRQRLTGVPRTLYGIKYGKAWRIPRFQFDRKKLVPGIGGVIAALPDSLHPVAVYHWFTAPHPDLSIDDEGEQHISPLDWLRTGREPEVVADLARAL